MEVAPNLERGDLGLSKGVTLTSTSGILRSFIC